MGHCNLMRQWKWGYINKELLFSADAWWLFMFRSFFMFHCSFWTLIHRQFMLNISHYYIHHRITQIPIIIAQMAQVWVPWTHTHTQLTEYKTKAKTKGAMLWNQSPFLPAFTHLIGTRPPPAAWQTGRRASRPRPGSSRNSWWRCAADASSTPTR